MDLFSDEDMDGNVQPISRVDYERLLAYLQKKNPAAILPVSYTHLDVYKRQQYTTGGFSFLSSPFPTIPFSPA